MLLSAALLLTGCNETNLKKESSSDAVGLVDEKVVSMELEQGIQAVKSGDFETAENRFRLILKDNEQHREAIDWLAFTEKCRKLETKIENKEVAEMKELYASLQTHPYASAIATQFKELEQDPANVYENKKLGFKFEYPESWIGHLEISDSKEGFYSSEEIDFTYVNAGKGIEQFVFSVVVYDGVMTDNEWTMQQYLADDGEKTYVLVLAGEPTEALLKEENEEDLLFVQNMLEEVEMIMDTFTLEGGKAQSKELYNNYTNILFDFSLEYPSSLTMSTEQLKEEGVHLYHEDFAVKVFGDDVGVGQTLESYYYYEEDVAGLGEVIEQRLEEDSYVISYEKDGVMTYIKSVFNEETFSKLTITYPVDQEEKYVEWVEAISDSFYILGH